jgi:Txe/YoeB family toxin of Txe-Axe toxin-antitoxin module
MEKRVSVVFVNEKLEKEFEKLREDSEFKRYLNRAIQDIKENPFCGAKIQKKLFPKEYIKKYNITNLWKYDLPKAWRIIYTLVNENEAELLSVILEWFDHKEYERRFHYN